MRSKTLFVILTVVILLSIGLSACQPAAAPVEEPAAEVEAPAEEVEEPAADPLKVLYITEDPIGVNPYFISGQEGLEMAAKDFGVETKVLECTGDATNVDENLRAVSREDWDLIIAITFGFEDTLNEVAPATEDKWYVCIDCAVDVPNVRNVGFKTYESAYLLGIAAGMLTETNKIGQIGPVEMPFMYRWTVPFTDAAKSVNPDVEVLDTLWVGDWADPATAKELALTLADQGVDIIGGAAAAGGPGVFEAAVERDIIAAGVDINECPKAPGHMLESNVKRVDLAIYNTIKDLVDGNMSGGFVDYGLKEGGVDLAVFAYPDTDTECILQEHPDVVEKVAEVRQEIIDGTLVIADPMFAE
jgi:basic membrane protein A and related proteins